MHANRPDLLENGVLILHNNARPHLKDVRELLLPHPLYSPNMSPPDFDLFPKLKINMHGRGPFCFRTRRVRQLNCCRELTDIMDPPKRWDAVIRQDYTKGLLTLYRTSGALFCRYCVLCICFEMTHVWQRPRRVCIKRMSVFMENTSQSIGTLTVYLFSKPCTELKLFCESAEQFATYSMFNPNPAASTCRNRNPM
jgi:hypothetical protein